jgi:hypothetical protein
MTQVDCRSGVWAGFKRFRRATHTPFNLVFEAART